MKDNKANIVNYGFIVVLVNLIMWILLVGFIIMDLGNGNAKNTLDSIMIPYLFNYNTIVIGFLYVALEKKISNKYNVQNTKITKFTIVLWNISSVVLGFLVMKLHGIRIIPRIGDFFPGLEYIIYIFDLIIQFTLTVLVGKKIIEFINNKLKTKNNNK